MNNTDKEINISNYEEFAEGVVNQINKVIGSDITAKLYIRKKNNDVDKIGIVMKKDTEDLAPVIYLEELTNRFLTRELVEKIANKIIAVYVELRNPPFDFAPEMLQEFGFVKDKILLKIVNTEENQKMLANCPHYEVLDFSVVFYTLLDKSSDVITMLIENNHIKHWNVSGEELLSIAMENSKRILPATLFTIEETLQEMMYDVTPKNLLESELEKDLEIAEMYVLTNENRIHGAGCIFYPRLLDEVGAILEKDFYILPSSIHEVIIIPVTDRIDMECINEMICEINEKNVAKEERLGNRSYRYSITERKFY